MANDLNILLTDVQESYEKTLPSEKSAWVNQKIDEAVNELLNYIPSLPQRIEDGLVNRNFVKDKVVGAVLRVVRNPEGLESEGEGDYTYRLNKTVASGDIWYLEKDLLSMGWVAPLKRSVPRTVFSTPSRGFGFPR